MSKEDRVVLVIDDSAIIRQEVKIAVEEMGFRVVEASDGKEGCRKVEEYLKTLIAMIIDVNMPNMNGLEMLEYLEENGMATNVPKIMLTTESPSGLMKSKESSDKLRFWLIKPVRKEKIIRSIEKALKKKD